MDPNNPRFDPNEGDMYSCYSQQMRLSASQMSETSSAPSTMSSQQSYPLDTAGSPITPVNMAMSPMPIVRSHLSPILPSVYTPSFVGYVSMRDVEPPKWPMVRPLDDESTYAQSNFGFENSPWSYGGGGGYCSTPMTSQPESSGNFQYPMQLNLESEQQDHYESSHIEERGGVSPQSPSSTYSSSEKHGAYDMYLRTWLSEDKPTGYICKLCEQSAKDPPKVTEQRVFKRKTDSIRHVKCVHLPHLNKFDCKVKKCARKGNNGFTRKDHYNEHLRETHKMDVPKSLKGRDGGHAGSGSPTSTSARR